MGLRVGAQAVNTTRYYRLSLSGKGGASLAGEYTGAEVLTARLWAGDDRAPAATLTAAWDPDLAGNPASVTSPRILLTVAKATVQAVTPATYFLQVLIGDTPVLPDGSTFELLPGPGAAAAGFAYITLDKMRRFVPWIDTAIAAHPTAQSDLAEQLAEASAWVNATALARAERILERQQARHDPVVEVTPLTIASGVDWGPEWGVSIYPDTTRRAQLEDIADALAAGHLVVTSYVAAAVAWRATAIVCEPLLGDVAETRLSWSKLASEAKVRSSRLLASETLKVQGGGLDIELVP